MSSEVTTSVVSGQSGNTGLVGGSQPAPAADSPAPEAITQEGARETAEPAKPEEDPRFSARFAALARREKALIQKEKEASDRFKTVQEYEEAKRKFETDPLSILDAHGWSFDKLTNFILNDRKLSPEDKIEMLEKRLEQDKQERHKEKEEQEKRKKELEEKDYEDTLQAGKSQVKKFIEANADTFELVHSNDAFDVVFEVLSEHFRTTQEVMPLDQACQEVENWLEKEARERILKLKKFQPKASEVPETLDKPRSGALPPTLTNQLVASSAPSTTSTRHLSDEESKREAAKTLQRLLNERR